MCVVTVQRMIISDKVNKNSFLSCNYWKNERMVSPIITKLSIHICLHNTLTFNFGQTGLVWFCGLSKPIEREHAPFLWCYLKGLLYLVRVQDFHIKRCISLLALICSKRLLSFSPQTGRCIPDKSVWWMRGEDEDLDYVLSDRQTKKQRFTIIIFSCCINSIFQLFTSHANDPFLCLGCTINL